MLFAIAGKFIIEVDTGYHPGKALTLRKNNPEVLIILTTISFEGKAWAGSVIQPGFIHINSAMFQDFFNFSLSYPPAVHPAAGMFTIGKLLNTSVKQFTINILCFCFMVIQNARKQYQSD